MEIIKNFGIDPILLGAQIVNFLIVLYILRRFLYKPVLGTLKKRKDAIKEGLKNAEEAHLRLETAIEEEKNILKNAQIQSKKLIEDAKKEGLEMVQKTQSETKIQADRILNETRLQIAIETKEAEKRLAKNISRLATELIQKSTLELFKKDEQEMVMRNVLNKFKEKVF